jgi:hypothetical protein
MRALPVMNLPADWKKRTRVFKERKVPSEVMVPMVSQQTYTAERGVLRVKRKRKPA